MKEKYMKQYCTYLLFIWCTILGLVSCQNKRVLHISGSLENDLVKVLKNREELEIRMYSNPQEALESVEQGEGLIVLSTSYPEKRVELPDGFYQTITDKNIRAFIEYPSFVPGVEMGEMVQAHAERAVVNSGFFGEKMDSLQILGLNGLNFISLESPVANMSHMVAAKVAGFDSAIFGLPEQTAPLLFSWENYPVMVSTTNLSQFISGRYAPQNQWAVIWESIIEFIVPQSSVGGLEWTPTVSPTFSKNEDLPEDFQRKVL